METLQSNRPYQRQPYRSTHLITTVASLAGARPRMLRAAFRAGLADRRTGENVSKGVEWSGLGAMLAAGGVLAEKAMTEGVDHPLLIVAAATFAAIGSITFGVGTFGRMTREQANRSNDFMRQDPLAAMHDVLGQRQIWDEMDANLLGRGIESMTSYIKRNTDALLNRPAFALADLPAAALATRQPQPVQAQLATLAETADAKALLAEHELQKSLIRTWGLVERCVEFAYSERMLRRRDATARMVDALAQPAFDNLHSLHLLPVVTVPVKPAANPNSQPAATIAPSA